MKKNIFLDQGKYQSFDFQEFVNPNCFLGPAYAWIWNDKLTKENEPDLIYIINKILKVCTNKRSKRKKDFVKKYEEIILRLIYLEKDDVITASMTDSNNDGVYDGETKEPEIWG